MPLPSPSRLMNNLNALAWPDPTHEHMWIIWWGGLFFCLTIIIRDHLPFHLLNPSLGPCIYVGHELDLKEQYAGLVLLGEKSCKIIKACLRYLQKSSKIYLTKHFLKCLSCKDIEQMKRTNTGLGFIIPFNSDSKNAPPQFWKYPNIFSRRILVTMVSIKGLAKITWDIILTLLFLFLLFLNKK